MVGVSERVSLAEAAGSATNQPRIPLLLQHVGKSRKGLRDLGFYEHTLQGLAIRRALGCVMLQPNTGKNASETEFTKPGANLLAKPLTWFR